MLNKYIAGVVISSLTLVSFSSFAEGNYMRDRYIADNYGDGYVGDRYSGDQYDGDRYEGDRYDRDQYQHRGSNARYHEYGRRHTSPHEEQTSFHNVPSRISGGNVVKVDLGNRTWAAYDGQGSLVKSGRVSGGKDYCPDIHRHCRTVTGTFTIYSKQGPGCISKRFPVGRGGAKMPYCMFFHGGYALHGSYEVPNYNASHGCVRMVPSDAQWLNQNFVRVGSTRVNIHY